MRDGVHQYALGPRQGDARHEQVVAAAPVKGILLERDQNYPPMAEMLAELRIARQILAAASRPDPKQVVAPPGQPLASG